MSKTILTHCDRCSLVIDSLPTTIKVLNVNVDIDLCNRCWGDWIKFMRKYNKYYVVKNEQSTKNL